MNNIFGFTVKNTQGADIPLSDYAGKVVLIVNTATHCGFTPQYRELQTLYSRYAAEGFEILDFPCNQFRGQAPESGSEIAQICETRFGTQFTTFEKIDVNGADAHPLYVYLKTQQPKDEGGRLITDGLLKLASLDSKRAHGDIQWNFTKFLVNREGLVTARFAPSVAPLAIEKAICELL